MRQTKIIEIDYFDGKEEKTVKIKIERIPQSIIRDYGEVSSVMSAVFKASEELKRIAMKKGDIVFSRDKDAKRKIDELAEEELEHIDIINSLSNDDFYSKRYALIIKLLKKNGITDEKLLTREFWEDDVDNEISATFLEQVIYKDFEPDNGKKKAQKV